MPWPECWQLQSTCTRCRRDSAHAWWLEHIFAFSIRICCAVLLQAELTKLQQQLVVAQQAAAEAENFQQAAAHELLMQEQQHQQQVGVLEQQLRNCRWQLWDAAASNQTTSAVSRLSRAGHSQLLVGASTSLCHLSDVRVHEQIAEDPEPQPMVHAADVTVPQRLQASHTQDPGNVHLVQQDCRSAAAHVGNGPQYPDDSSTEADFTVRLVASGPADGKLEMLPEVIKLLEVHRNLMAGC